MKLKDHIGKMAVIMDEEAGTTEMLLVDEVELVSIVINAVTGVAQFALAFGGRDTNGKFHLDSRRANEVAHVTLTREADPEVFNALFCDDKGSPRWDYPKEFFENLASALLLQVAHRQIWGAKHPEMEVIGMFTSPETEKKKLRDTPK